MYVKLYLARMGFLVLCSLLIYACRFLISHVCVAVGGGGGVFNQ